MHDQSEGLWTDAPEPTLAELTEAVKMLYALNRSVPPWIARHLKAEEVKKQRRSTPANIVEAEPVNPIWAWRMDIEPRSNVRLVHELFNLQEEVRVLCENHPKASERVGIYSDPTPEQGEYGILQMKLSFLEQLFGTRRIHDSLIQQVRFERLHSVES